MISFETIHVLSVRGICDSRGVVTRLDDSYDIEYRKNEVNEEILYSVVCDKINYCEYFADKNDYLSRSSHVMKILASYHFESIKEVSASSVLKHSTPTLQ